MRDIEDAGVVLGMNEAEKISHRSIVTTDGHRLHEAFLTIPDSAVVHNSDMQEAKDRLDYLFQVNPDVVTACADKTLAEATLLLQQAEQEFLQREAA